MKDPGAQINLAFYIAQNFHTSWSAGWVNDTNEPVLVRYQQLECKYSENSDPPAHPHSLIRVLVFRLRKLGPLTIHRAPIKTSDQTARMQRLFWLFVGRTCQLYIYKKNVFQSVKKRTCFSLFHINRTIVWPSDSLQSSCRWVDRKQNCIPRVDFHDT